MPCVRCHGDRTMNLVLAILRRDWAIERTYQLRLILRLVDMAVIAVAIYFMSLMVDPSSLGDYGGNYFDFAVVGLAVTAFAGVGLSSFGESLAREQNTGTIDLLLASPAPIPQLMIGMFMLPFLIACVQIAGLLGFGIGVVGSGIPLGGLLMSVPVMLLTTATFAAVGVAIGGLMLLVKRGDPISGPFYQASMLLSGVIVPVDILPKAIQVISWMLPATWGIRAVRELLLADAGWRDVAAETLVLTGFAIVMLPASILAYRWCLRTAVRSGVLGSY